MNNTNLIQKPLISYKEELIDDDFAVEYEILPAYNKTTYEDLRRNKITESINDIDSLQKELEEKISNLNTDIYKLTNHADGIDYAVAVTSGLITGIIDVVVVGKWDFEKAKAKSNKEINEKVMEFAKKEGYEGNRLDEAVEHLENKFKLPGDNDWNTKADFVKKAKEKGFTPPDGKKGRYEDALKFMNEHYPKKDGSWGVVDNFITTKTHHLDDFCHHPTLVGLICNVIVQFTGTSIYSNKIGENINIPVTINDYGQFQGNNFISKFFCGIINWFFNVAKAMANAKGHWMSDLAGSKSSAGKGAGLPGSLMSFMKELSALPLIKDTDFAGNLQKAYQNGIGTGKKQVDLGVFNELFKGADSKFDYRTENAIKGELKRQALPVIINEVLVRGFYFIRRFILELKKNSNLMEINWKNVIPLNNRTIVRMMTIASGTFTAVDLLDATVESCVKGGAPIVGGIPNPKFFKEFILHINFVGIGRFAIAVGTDVGMGIKRQSLIKERMQYKAESNMLHVSKIYYLQEDMWIEATDTEKAVDDMCQTAENSMIYFVESWNDISDNLEKIQNVNIDQVNEKNPGLVDDLKDILEWG